MPTSIYNVGLENGEYSNVNKPNSGVEVVTWKSSVHSVLKKVNSHAVIVVRTYAQNLIVLVP